MPLRKYAGTELPVFLEASNLKSFISQELRPVLSPMIFITDNGPGIVEKINKKTATIGQTGQSRTYRIAVDLSFLSPLEA